MPQWRIYCPFCAGTEMKVAHGLTSGTPGYEVSRCCKECGASPEEIASKLSADGLPPDAVPLAP